MRIVFTIVIFLFFTSSSSGQIPGKEMKKMGQNPTLFLDSMETNMRTLHMLNPCDISNIRIVKPKKAKKLLGDRGVDGAIYVTTVNAAKIKYWNYFASKSFEYQHLINSPQADTIVQYILNGEPLSDTTAPGRLFLINDKTFKTLDIIDKENGKFLMENVIPQRYLVIITAKKPKDL